MTDQANARGDRQADEARRGERRHPKRTPAARVRLLGGLLVPVVSDRHGRLWAWPSIRSVGLAGCIAEIGQSSEHAAVLGGARVQPQLLEDARHVFLHRGIADNERFGDAVV